MYALYSTSTGPKVGGSVFWHAYVYIAARDGDPFKYEIANMNNDNIFELARSPASVHSIGCSSFGSIFLSLRR